MGFFIWVVRESAQELLFETIVVFQRYLFKSTHQKLGPPVVPFYPFFGGCSPTKIDYRKNGTLVLSSLLEDLERPPHT